MRSNILKVLALGVLAVPALLVAGCVLAPEAAEDERAALRDAGRQYAQPFSRRPLPELPVNPDWPDVLRRAYLANGELEAVYFQWAAAVHRIQQAGSYPNSPLMVGFEQMFEDGGTTVFDDSALRVEAMDAFAFPPKVYQAAKVALDEARAARERFRAAKLELRRQVLTAWFDYALLAERRRISGENLALLKLITDTTAARVRAGGAQQDLLRAEVAQRTAADELLDLESELARTRATLNAMMARDPAAPLPPPARFPPARAFAADDATLLVLAAEQNPELAALAHQARGRADAVELARLRYVPDFNPMADLTGAGTQALGLGLSIPTFLPEVRGMIREARAELREARAMYRQARFDRAAGVVAALVALRNSARQAEVFEQQILPRARQAERVARESYATGATSFTDLIEIQRTMLDIRLVIAEARAAREQSLAELEALIGAEIETLANAATTTQPGPQPTSPRRHAPRAPPCPPRVRAAPLRTPA
jgi:outer membrane protein TolC